MYFNHKLMTTIDEISPVFLCLNTEKVLTVEFASNNINQFGISQSDLASSNFNFTDIFCENDKNLVLNFFKDSSEKEQLDFIAKVKIKHVNKWIRVIFTPRKKKHSKRITHYECYMSDFTNVLQIIEKPILILNRTLEVVFANSSFCNLFNTCSKNISNKSLFELDSNKLKLKDLEKALTALLINNNDIKYSAISIQDDGSNIKKIAFSAKRIDTFKGNSTPILVEFEDITEFRKIESDLKDYKNKYLSILESSSDAIIIAQDEKLKFANSKFCYLTGYSEEDILEQPLLYFISVEYFRMFINRYRKCLSNEQKDARVYSVDIISKSDEMIPVEVTFIPTKHENKKAAMISLHDITDKVRTENALKLDEIRTESMLELNQMTNKSVREIINFAIKSVSALTDSSQGYVALIDLVNSTVKAYCYDAAQEEDKRFFEAIFNGSEVSRIYEHIYQKEAIIKDCSDTSPNIIKLKFPKKNRPYGNTVFVPIFCDDRIVMLSEFWGRKQTYAKVDLQTVILIIQDTWRIINNKLSESALKASEKKYSTLVEKGNDGIIIVQDEYLKFVNSKFCEIKGCNVDEVVGTPFLDVFPLEYSRMILKRYNKCLKTDTSPIRSYELELLYKDNTKVPVEASFSAIDHEGKPAVMITLRDITEQKRKENDLLNSLEVQKMLQNVIKTSPTIVFLWRAETNWPVEFVSDNIEKFGYTPEDFISGKLLFGDIIHPDDLEAVQIGLSNRFEDGFSEFSQEYRIITSSGEVRWVDERTFMQADQNGNLELLQGVIVDITDKKQAHSFMNVDSNLGYLLHPSNDLHETFEQLLDLALQVNEVDCGMIYIVDEITGDLNLITHKGLSEYFIEKTSHYDKNSMTSRLFKTGWPIYKLHSELLSITREQNLNRESLASTAIIPIYTNMHICAIMFLASYDKYEISENSRDSLEAIATRIGVILEKIKDDAETHNYQQDVHNVIESLEDLIFIIDYSGKILYLNQIAADRLEYERESIIGTNLVSLHSHDSQIEVATLLSDVIKGTISSCNSPFITKSGELVHKETKFSKCTWNKKNVIVALCRENSSKYF